MKTEGSSPWQIQPTTGPYVDLGEYNPPPHINSFFYIHFTITLPPLRLRPTSDLFLLCLPKY